MITLFEASDSPLRQFYFLTLQLCECLIFCVGRVERAKKGNCEPSRGYQQEVSMMPELGPKGRLWSYQIL